MSTALEVAGGQKQKQTRYAPIWTNRFFTGLWTQRNPLRDAATPYLYEKFYSGSRFDSLINGLNMELTNRLTLQRRAGSSVYNSSTFSAIKSFYPFKTFVSNAEAIKIIADTSTHIYDATGSSQINLLTKGTGAGQAYFQGVGNTLYISDGVEQKKYIQSAKTWVASSPYNIGDFIIDSNGNVQQVTYLVISGSNTLTITNNILTVTPTGTPIPTNIIGQSCTFSSTTLFANSVTLNVSSVTSTTISFSYQHANYSNAEFWNGIFTAGSGVSFTLQPTWTSTPGGTIQDNNLGWAYQGFPVVNWGIQTPVVAPVVANTALTPSIANWAASTWYGTSVGILIVDNRGTPCVEKLTTAGTTGGAQPTWNGIGSTTADNTAQWLNLGQAAWQSNNAYTISNIISVSYNITVLVPEQNPNFDGQGQPLIIYVPVVTSYLDFFQCTVAGTSHTGSASDIQWQPGVGSQVADGTVTWSNIGTSRQWTAIGGAAKVQTAIQIIDSGGNYENVIATGISAGTHPTWPTAIGGTVTETATTLVWQNAGPSSQVGNTGNWIYAFAPKNSVTGYVGSCSPQSLPIQKAVNSFINVQGNFVSDTQCDFIRLFRTVQGGSTLLFLADVANPTSGVWTFQDTNPDSNLNQFIIGDIVGNNAPPPTGLINLAYHLNKIWGSVGNISYYTNDQSSSCPNPFECFPALNSFTWPSLVVRHVPTPIGLLVFTVSDIFLISGQATSTSPLFPQPYIQGIGLANFNALDVNGTIIYLFTTDGQLLSLDPTAGVSEIGFPIGDKLSAFPIATTYVTWHVAGSADKALYISDGTGDWYRLNPTSAPETGQTWSPLATVAVGASAIQSIEVSPGLHKLLIAPASSGAILKRDLTVFADNSTPYTCHATIGSIVLAHPGQAAHVDFLTTDCTAVGSRPTFTYLMDEISGTFLTPSGSIPKDPPQLPASITTHADRFYLSNTGQEICRHMQIDFAFPAEAYQNEILSYTIFGAIGQEK